MRTRAVAVLSVLATLSLPLAGAAADPRPEERRTVVTVLPPGNSGHVSVPGQVQGMAGGPGDYGPHLDDQRQLYWSGRYKSGMFVPTAAAPETPRPGVRISRDSYGVPVIDGATAAHVWWGAGWSAGRDRLFLADAVRRYARGTYAELVGPPGLVIDRAAREVTYSTAEYDAMLHRLPAESQTAITSYVEGLNAWISKVRTDPTLLPAEYALLTTLPEPWTVTDTLAAGVLITRFVASAGGDEFQLVEVLRRLQSALGRAEGRKAFLDLYWQQDRKAPTTVPAADGAFETGGGRSEAQQRADFDAAADAALAFPPELGAGISAGVPAIPGKSTQDPDAFPLGGPAPAATPAPVVQLAFDPIQHLVDWARSLHGGSYQIAVAPKRSANGGALLESAPQLGYSYPSDLWELEVHGGGYDARGVSVPGIPTVGIGYGPRTAWALTTGNSKTIDSFVEKVRRTGGRLQSWHRGGWRDATCRTEVIRYRQSTNGVPFGAPVQSEDHEVCRTVHGPVVATSNDGTLARAMQMATWGRDLETINGILAWDRADDLRGFAAGVAQVTWNENVMYAGADGHIAYWHPGLHPQRRPGVDTRFPVTGDGSKDWLGLMPRDRLPHVIDPAQGWLVNWNNKPAVGWADTWVSDPTARPSGYAGRWRSIASQLAADSKVSFADLQRIDWNAGTRDHRAPTALPVVLRLLGTSGLSPSQRQVADLLRGWNGNAYGPGAGTSSGAPEDESVTDGPAPTAFRALAQALAVTTLRGLPPEDLQRSDTVANHVFDATPADNLVLRVLDPSTSSLRAQHDWLAGRTRQRVVRDAVDLAVRWLTARYGADPAGWRARHPRSPVESLTGVIGPSLSMPYEDRGSWIHLVSFAPPDRAAPRAVLPPAAPGPGLPATGPGALLPGCAAALVALAAALRRRRLG